MLTFLFSPAYCSVLVSRRTLTHWIPHIYTHNLTWDAQLTSYMSMHLPSRVLGTI